MNFCVFISLGLWFVCLVEALPAHELLRDESVPRGGRNVSC